MASKNTSKSKKQSTTTRKGSTKRTSTKSTTSSRSRKTPALTLTQPVALQFEQVAERAYLIWRDRGCPAGLDEQNWLDAEAQLRSELRAA